MLISAPLIFGAGALVFAALALRHFLARCLTFLTHLSFDSSPSDLTPFRYICIILMSSLQMVWALATTAYNLVFTLRYTTLRRRTLWRARRVLGRRVVFGDFHLGRGGGDISRGVPAQTTAPSSLAVFPRKKPIEQFNDLEIVEKAIFDDVPPGGLSRPPSQLPDPVRLLIIPYRHTGLLADSPRSSNQAIF
ncbi:hypothetical protein C8R45DRAFT_1215006 [Mycena sanguinolenta]|nr:hypothetical protein C8R45DRAFT_1215006 [Mycena sanguinolenta]